LQHSVCGGIEGAGLEVALEIATGRGHGVGGQRFQPMIKEFFDKHLRSGQGK